ncbi:hypothetical protein [Lysinibacillus pakistanensis]|uniref:Uncharacterized protein n=1 Tax=Lysinibacillus pakistanensis TaxID=759811 RepID=A0AAX3WUV6_9BACI|nr:hypothetical protein [Lysinibacillus pakistanensis]WHY45515.1 hypothetical protein QNH22_19695 [Lysinibacillus pakistanensis]WHY50523.1 hypothetical protein QNH24_19660 [Lysinibacillus pakistanensis]
MRKLPLVIIFCLICSLILPPSALGANTEYDHAALMEYEGYGQAIYETLVEETAYITGQYTNNKEYVNKSVDQLKDYAKFWWGEAKELNHASLQDVVSAGGGYFLTIGDWFKKTFGDYGDKYYPPIYNDLSKYVVVSDKCPSQMTRCSEFRVKFGYVLVINGTTKIRYDDGVVAFDYLVSGRADNSGFGRFIITAGSRYFYDGDTINFSPSTYSFFEQNQLGYEYYRGDFGKVIPIMNLFGVSAHFETDDSVVIIDDKPNDDFDRFKKYVDEKLDKIATPQPKPYLVCPNGTKIQMSVSGSTFLNSDGTVTVVNKDGTAQVDNVTCQLGWEKPEVKYIDDRAVIQTPDGKWQDAETGKAIVEKEPEPEKPTEPSNPSCNDSDNMEVDSGQCEGVPYFGSKLEFIFGNATGNKNHIDRSLAMELQLNNIGIFDDAKGKKLVLDNLSNTFDDPTSIRETLDNGRVVRTSVLKGPNGDLKVESVWDKEKLISVKLGEDVVKEPEDGTVWEYINITQPFYDGTKIPKSFELEADGEKFWVHPNGTKHMVEYITRDATTHGMPINSQTLLTSFHNSVKGAVKEGIKYEEIMNIGNWELIFSKPREDGLLPVIKHAVYMP